MARIIVTVDHRAGSGAPVLLEESVAPIHLSTDHAAGQLIERLAWALADAERLERDASDPAPSARPPARPRPRRRRAGPARPAYSVSSALT